MIDSSIWEPDVDEVPEAVVEVELDDDRGLIFLTHFSHKKKTFLRRLFFSSEIFLRSLAAADVVVVNVVVVNVVVVNVAVVVVEIKKRSEIFFYFEQEKKRVRFFYFLSSTEQTSSTSSSSSTSPNEEEKEGKSWSKVVDEVLRIEIAPLGRSRCRRWRCRCCRPRRFQRRQKGVVFNFVSDDTAKMFEMQLSIFLVKWLTAFAKDLAASVGWGLLLLLET